MTFLFISFRQAAKNIMNTRENIMIDDWNERMSPHYSSRERIDCGRFHPDYKYPEDREWYTIDGHHFHRRVEVEATAAAVAVSGWEI